MESTEQVLRVAVIGYGLAGRVFHAPFVSAVPGLALAAIVSSRHDEIRAAWPDVVHLAAPQDAFRSPEIDLIVVATPNETHYELARRALMAGKHVVVDKPMTSSSAQARELSALAARAGKVLAPFHNRRWDGDFLTVQRLIADGALGRIVSFESHFDRFRPLVRGATWKESGGDAQGLLMDLGPHLIDQTLALFGPPESLVASVRRDREGTAIEDAFDLWLQYRGFHAILRSTMLAADPQPRFLLHGTRGSFRKYGVDPQEPAIVAGAKVPGVHEDRPWLPEDAKAWGELTTAADPSQPDRLTRERVETIAGDYRGFYSNVRDAIRGQRSLAVTAEDARRVLRLIELARKSSRNGTCIAADLD